MSDNQATLEALREKRVILELEREQRLFESEERLAREERVAHQRGLGVNLESLAVRALEERERANQDPFTSQLHESLSYYDWFDQSPFGQVNDLGMVLGSGVGAGGMMNPISTRMDRRQGRMLPFLQTEQDLMLQRGIARIMTTLSCPAQGVLGSLTNYVVGEKGFKFTIDIKRERDKDRIPDGLIEALQECLDEFQEDCHWADLQAELFMRSRRDGEYFLALYESPGGKTKPRIFEPEQITETGSARWTPQYIRSEHGQELPDRGDWYWGILTPFHDVCEVHGFNAFWDTLGESEYLPAAMLQHFKLSDRNVKRGLSDFYPAFRMLQKSGSLASKIVSQAVVQAGIAGIRQHPAGRTQQEVSTWRTNQSDFTSNIMNPFGGGRTVYNQVRPEAQMLDVPWGQEYLYGPMGSPSGPAFIDVLQAGLRWVSTKWNMPEFLISGDASNQNFASALVSESPFVKTVKFLQHRYGPRWVAVLWKVLENAAEWGRFDRFGEWGSFHALRRFLQISVDYPRVETRNRKEETDRLKVLCDDGIIAKSTRQAEEGYDGAKEDAKGAAQRPSEITAKAASVDQEGEVTGLATPGKRPGEGGEEQGQGAKPPQKPPEGTGGDKPPEAKEGDQAKPDAKPAGQTSESAGAVQPSAMADINAYDQGAGLIGDRKRRLHETSDLRQAIKAAADATDRNPSEARKESGNYAKGKFNWYGLPITIETPKGATRSKGDDWEIKMPMHYGYFRRTVSGADGDAVDVFVGPDPESQLVFVLDQVRADGSFDEHKCLIGFLNEDEAVEAYRSAYPKGWKVGPVTAMTLDQFKDWLAEGDTSRPLALHETAFLFESAEHAPKGGATINGKPFAGGQFIPAADMAKATPHEKKALEEKKQAAKHEIPENRKSIPGFAEAATYEARSRKPAAGQGGLWDEGKHPRDAHGEFSKGSGGASSGKSSAPASADEGEFRLQNKPEHKKAEVENNANTSQRKLLDGMDALPGQQDLFDEPEKPATAGDAVHKEAKKIFKAGRQDVLGPGTTQKRAKAGGELGANNEWYEGGKFIATQDLPKRIRDKLAKKAVGRVQVDGYKWEQPQPGQMSILDKLAGTVLNPRNGEVNEGYLEYIHATPEQVSMYKDLAQKWINGERWVSVNDYPGIAGIKDAALLVAAGKPIPEALFQRLPEQWREHLTKWKPKPQAETEASVHESAAIRLARRAAELWDPNAPHQQESFSRLYESSARIFEAAKSDSEGQWITIGAHRGEGGKSHGGTPVKISGGKITHGPPALAGKTLRGLFKTKPHTELKRAVNNAHKEHGFEKKDIADAIEFVHGERKRLHDEREKAKEHARKATGLTSADISRLSNAGHDYASGLKAGGVTGDKLRHFDAIAQEAAREHPELGLGDPDNPHGDFSQRLWDVLGEGKQEAPAKHHEDTVNEAIQLLHQNARYKPSGEETPF